MHTPALEEFELEDLPSDEIMSDEQLAEHALKNTQTEENATDDVEEAKFEEENVEAHQKPSHDTSSDDKINLLIDKLNELINTIEKQTSAAKVQQTAAQQFAAAVKYIKTENNHYLGAKWFRKAAIQGHPKAQLYLGLMFLKGEGLPKSLFHAYSWLSIAACQNVAEAQEALVKLEPHLTAKEMRAALKHAANIIESIHD